MLKTAGVITHLLVEADHFRDLEDAAGVGKAHDCSGDIVIGLPLGRNPVTSYFLPSMTLELSLLPLCLAVLTETGASSKCGETLLSCFSSTTLRIGRSRILERNSWFARFLSQRSGDSLDWCRFWRSTLRLWERGWGSRGLANSVYASWRGGCHDVLDVYNCDNSEDTVRQMQKVENANLQGYRDTERKGKDHFGIREKAALFAWVHRGATTWSTQIFWTVSWEVEEDASIMKQTREVRGATLGPEKREGRYVAHACGSGCGHLVSCTTKQLKKYRVSLQRIDSPLTLWPCHHCPLFGAHGTCG